MAGTAGENQGRDDLGEAWRWGIDASRQMGERLLELYGEVGKSAFDGLAGNGGDELRQVRIDMERWVDLSVTLFDRAFSLLRVLGGDGQNGNGNGNGHGAPERISLRGPAGARCGGDLWVHNVSGGERATPLLRCSALNSAAGDEIAASHVLIDTEQEPLHGGASRRVTVEVDVPADAAGVYHGQILSDASPDSVILLRLTVDDA
jgi:hypothetical protein